MTDRPTFTLAEAVRASDRSRSTLQRDLKAGTIAGAHRADPDDPASPWVIPADGLIAAGYRLHAPTGSDELAPAADASTVRADELADLRRRAEVAEALAAERAATLADLREALDATRLALRALTAGDAPPQALHAPESAATAPAAPDLPADPVTGLGAPLVTRFRRAWRGFTD